MIDMDIRRNRFTAAVTLLGGQRAVAAMLKISDRHMRYLLNGDHEIKQGFMRDITVLLRRHADDCNMVARDTDPLFSANWTAAEAAAQEKARG